MRIKIAKSEVYVPEWNDNRKLDEDEQIKVHINFPKVKDYNNLRDFKMTTGNGESGERMFTFNLNYAKLFPKFITKIENLYAVDNSGNEYAITTGQELVDAGSEFEGLAQELGGYIMQTNRGLDDDPKNL
jgi:hypothetical protein